MAIVRFIGDIHLGKRPSHSTRASAQRHKEKVDKVIRQVCDNEADLVIQLGDLFDSYQATNNDMVRAAYLHENTNLILKGNHDHSHSSFNVSALEDLEKLQKHGAHIVTEPEVHTCGAGEHYYVHFVPYMPTQTEFIAALAKMAPVKGSVNILCLHTNMYAEGFSVSEVENNLPEITARELCHDFDLVISGHEHCGRQKHGVYMAGCLFPMNFGDISDKYVLDFDTDTKEVTPVPVWSAEGTYPQENSVAPVGAQYARLDPQEFLGVPVLHGYDFIEIYGNVQTTDILQLVKHMNLLLAESGVSSIKNGVKVIRETADEDGPKEAGNWLDYVKESLKPEQFELLQELRDD